MTNNTEKLDLHDPIKESYLTAEVYKKTNELKMETIILRTK